LAELAARSAPPILRPAFQRSCSLRITMRRDHPHCARLKLGSKCFTRTL
jgi:hypothetical protein